MFSRTGQNYYTKMGVSHPYIFLIGVLEMGASSLENSYRRGISGKWVRVRYRAYLRRCWKFSTYTCSASALYRTRTHYQNSHLFQSALSTRQIPKTRTEFENEWVRDYSLPAVSRDLLPSFSFRH